MPHLPKQHRPPRVKGRRLARRPSPSKRGYGARWQRIRRRVLDERMWCADLFSHHRSMGPSAVAATIVDHIVPLRDGGTNDDANLQCLCASCHSRKTALQDGGFGRPKRSRVLGE